jgi:hypoxanthine phosphoribosyltransferase
VTGHQSRGQSPKCFGYTASVHGDIDKVLIDRARIAQRIKELGAQIGADLQHLSRDAEIVVVPILTGSIIFVADLMRELPLKLRINVAAVSSYPGTSTTSKGASIAGALPSAADLQNKHVLIVDDILDSGSTIRLVREQILLRKPRSVRTCVLLRKSIPSALNTPCEYIGFDIADEFVVGYGLDYDNYYRNLPDVGTLKREVM